MPLNIKVLDEGSIPWSAEEYWAVIEERARLEVTPHDDWKRNLGRFMVPDLPSGPAAFRFNPDMVTNQIMDFMVTRYRHLDQLTTMSHMNRYMVMNEFLRVNTERLTMDKLIKRLSPDDPDGDVALAHALIEVLAEASYEATMINLGGHEVRTFDYEKVVAAARAKIEAEDEAAG